MAATLQIITLIATFLLAFLLGVIFEVGYFQAAIVAKEKLGDLPLPLLTSVLSDNHRALGYVMLLPWIGLAGGPVLQRSRPYFDSEWFLLRFAAFAAIESLLALVFLLFLVLPFLPFYMLSDLRSNTILETIAGSGFWVLILTVSVFGIRKGMAKRGKNQDEQGKSSEP